MTVARISATAALVGVALSGLVAWGVAEQTSDAALDTQRQQIDSAREDRDHGRRSEVDEEFADAANNFALAATFDYPGILRRPTPGPGPRAIRPPGAAGCRRGIRSARPRC